MAIVISANCLALHHDKDLTKVKQLIDANIKPVVRKRHAGSVMSIARKSERKHGSVMEVIRYVRTYARTD